MAYGVTSVPVGSSGTWGMAGALALALAVRRALLLSPGARAQRPGRRAVLETLALAANCSS
jgi:hypothetical protein